MRILIVLRILTQKTKIGDTTVISMTLIAQQTGRLAAKAISSLKRDRFIRQLPRLYASAGSEKSIVPPNVRDLAKLAQIDVSDEEVWPSILFVCACLPLKR